jgi:SAM-dependent methyltransferase
MSFRQPIKTWSTPVTEEEQRPVPCALCGGGRFKPSLSCEGFSYVKCAGCGLVQINPQPVAVDVRRRYGQSHGDAYFAYELNNEAVFLDLQKRAFVDAGFDRLEQQLMKGINTAGQSPAPAAYGGFPQQSCGVLNPSFPHSLDHARASTGAISLRSSIKHNGQAPSVLDVGCATGAMLSFLRERGWQTVGVEISPAAEYARHERGLDVRRQCFEDCRFPSESFDMVLASHLIEHLNDPGVFFREAWRVLRNGAYLMLITPNINGFQARLLGSRWRSAIFDHLYLFSAHTVKAMLKAHGFTAEGMYTWGGLAAGIAPMPVKAFADRTAKALGLGDVMLVKARKKS